MDRTVIMHPGGELPQPDAVALAHSQRVVEALRREIAAQGGTIGFDRYMDIALYAAGLGYYSAGAHKLGPGGDFMTAPEISPIFSRCVAAQCAQVLQHMGGGAILELGAGSGAMVCDVLVELAQRQALPESYLILEISADLRARQQARVRAQLPELAQRVQWLESLPETPIRGVILANEVLDALPVSRFRWRNGVPADLVVGQNDREFTWAERSPRPDFDPAVAALLGACHDGYTSEWNPRLAQWIDAVAAVLDSGLLLFMDYGHPRREFYHTQRVDGTLRCHYQHRAHADPFLWPGMQDITAAVDFTAVADAASHSGLELRGFTTQAHFLIGCGLEQMAAGLNGADIRRRATLSRQVQVLTLPAEMGEIIKAMALTRDLALPLIGFSGPDHRRRL
jgi:SAM-dependent MidA family methyltransferase